MKYLNTKDINLFKKKVLNLETTFGRINELTIIDVFSTEALEEIEGINSDLFSYPLFMINSLILDKEVVRGFISNNHNNIFISTTLKIDKKGFNKDLYRTYNPDCIFDHQAMGLGLIDQYGHKPKKFELVISKFDELNLIFPAIKYLTYKYSATEFYLRLSHEGWCQESSYEKLKTQLELISIYIENAPYVYFSPATKNFKEWDAMVQNRLSGPTRLDIDVSNYCTHNCVFCACYSDATIESFSKDGKLDPQVDSMMKEKIDSNFLNKILKDLPREIECVQLGGMGDPFTHPEIMDIIQKLRDRNLRVEILTNFAYMNEKKILKLHRMTSQMNSSLVFIVNISGATPGVYIRSRPNQTEESFFRIKKMLKLTKSLKVIDKIGVEINLMCVINSTNCHDLTDFIKYALEVAAKSVWYKPMELHSETLEAFKINDSMRAEYVLNLEWACVLADKHDVNIYQRVGLEQEIKLNKKIISSNKLLSEQYKTLNKEFKIKYNDVNYEKKSRVLYKNDTSSIPAIFFDGQEISNKELTVKKADHTSKETIGIDNGDFPKDYYSALPCFIGNQYLRFQINGTASPCCISRYEIDLKDSELDLRKIWTSNALNLFRNKTEKIDREHFHIKQDEWKFCQQCSHMNLNTKYNNKRGFKFSTEDDQSDF
jgi:organic radical activating enzyme